MAMSKNKIRVSVQQPSLAKYRVPLFDRLSSQPELELLLNYSSKEKSLPNEEPVGFNAKFIPMKFFPIGRRTFLWHSSQWDLADSRYSDVLILSWDLQYLSLIPSLLKARINGVKTILWGHGYSKKESKLRKFMRDSVGKLADAIILYDHFTAECFINNGWSPRKVFVAPNSLDQVAIQRARTYWLNNESLLKNFSVDNNLKDKNNLIYIGRIYEDNNLEILFYALADVVKSIPNIQLIIIGEENEYSNKLKQLASRLGVSSKVIWLGSIYDENKIAPYMILSSLCCYPSNIGLSIMHAFGYGTPVITNNDIPSHNPEIHALEDGINGFLYQVGSVSDLSKTIVNAINNKNLSDLGNLARQKVLSGFTIDHMTSGFLNCIKEVVDEG